jgi:hypothetical protein
MCGDTYTDPSWSSLHPDFTLPIVRVVSEVNARGSFLRYQNTRGQFYASNINKQFQNIQREVFNPVSQQEALVPGELF